jgi:hypothetical protein
MGKNLDGFMGVAPVTVAQRLNPQPSAASGPAAAAPGAVNPAAAPARKPAPPARKKTS